MEDVRPRRIGLVIGGISLLLIVVMTYVLTSSTTVHPITPHDVKATIPAGGSFTAGVAEASAAAATGSAAVASTASATAP